MIRGKKKMIEELEFDQTCGVEIEASGCEDNSDIISDIICFFVFGLEAKEREEGSAADEDSSGWDAASWATLSAFEAAALLAFLPPFFLAACFPFGNDASGCEPVMLLTTLVDIIQQTS